MSLERYIRTVPDWPKKGISFKDITPLLKDGKVFRAAIQGLARPFKRKTIDAVAGIDARGFLLAGAMAQELHCGVAIVRKKGKLPWKRVRQSYALEYGMATLEMHRDAVRKGERILIVDDILATGGTLGAAIKLIEKLGGIVVGISVLGTLDFLPGAVRIAKKYPLHSLIHFDS